MIKLPRRQGLCVVRSSSNLALALAISLLPRLHDEACTLHVGPMLPCVNKV